MFCELFGYTKQAYYKQFKHQVRCAESYHSLKAEVLQIRRQMPRLGTRKLHFLLSQTCTIGRDKLFDLLRKEGLLVLKRKNILLLQILDIGCGNIPTRLKA